MQSEGVWDMCAFDANKLNAIQNDFSSPATISFRIHLNAVVVVVVVMVYVRVRLVMIWAILANGTKYTYRTT